MRVFLLGSSTPGQDIKFNEIDLINETTIKGVVTAEPDVRDDLVWLTVEDEETGVKLRVATEHFPKILYGDEVLFTGELSLPENFKTDTGRIFDYIGYLKKDGIKYVVWRPEIKVLDSGGGNLLVSSLFSLKGSFKSNVDKVISEPHASLAGGILLGSKQGLGKKLEDAFRDTGIVHIVVLSGYNVTIVALFILWIFSFLPFKIARALAMSSIILFAVVVGGGATVVRASLMATLAIFAPVIHRTYTIHRALSFAALLMVALNPYTLVFDPSF